MLPDLGAGHLLGDAFSLATALCMAGAFTMSRRVQEPLGLAPSLGGGMSALVLAPFVPEIGFETLGQAILMALEGAVLMPVALGLIALAPRYLPAPQVGLFLLLEAVLGPHWVWLFIGETPTANSVLGGVIVVSAIVVHTLFWGLIYMTEVLQPYTVPRPRPATRRDSFQEHSRTHRDGSRSR